MIIMIDMHNLDEDEVNVRVVPSMYSSVKLIVIKSFPCSCDDLPVSRRRGDVQIVVELRRSIMTRQTIN